MSLRKLFLLVTITCVSLMLTRIDFVTGAWFLLAAIALAGFFVEHRTWRCLSYGAVLGIIAGFVLLLSYSKYKLGYVNASNYSESNEIGEIVAVWKPYVIQFGALLGAGVGLLTFGKKGILK